MMLAAAACATMQPVSYTAAPLENGEYDITFVSIALPDDAHEAELAKRVAATCSGAASYALRDLDVQEVLGLDDAENTPRRTTKATLACEASA
jgi:hypothetical protein